METKDQALERFAKSYKLYCMENGLDVDSLENVRRWSGVSYGKVPADAVCKKIAKAALGV